MNIAFDLYTFNPLCVHFMDKKANNIIQGIFTKIIYSTDFYSMVGIYIKVPIKHIDGCDKQNIQINYSNIKNGKILQGITSIEEQLLDLYKKYTNNTKQPIYSLNTQLLYGSLKIYKENHLGSNVANNISSNAIAISHSIIDEHNHDHEYKKMHGLNLHVPSILLLKIAGIWENETHYGITFKFIE